MLPTFETFITTRLGVSLVRLAEVEVFTAAHELLHVMKRNERDRVSFNGKKNGLGD